MNLIEESRQTEKGKSGDWRMEWGWRFGAGVWREAGWRNGWEERGINWVTEMKGCALVSPILILTPSIILQEHHSVLHCVAAAFSSCVQLYICVINLFACFSQPVYVFYLYSLCHSVNISAHHVSMYSVLCCTYVLSVYVCVLYACPCCLLQVAHLVLLCSAAQPTL